MSTLEQQGVFFEPAHELYYYKGLGHLARANGDLSGDEQVNALRRSIENWKRFLERGGSASPWADLARTHLEQTREQLESLESHDGSS
jgi:hypothetical protein